MNKVVIYASMTGHSKKIALAIANELGIEAYNVKNKPILEDIDLLFIVGGIYGGNSSPNLIEYLNNDIKAEHIKKVALLTSSASKKAKQTDTRDILTKKGINVLEEEFTCKGAFLLIGLGHPNKGEIADAVEFAKGVK